MKKKLHENEEDIVIEPEATGESSFKTRGEKELREALAATEKEKQEFLAGWQRAKADLINYKKEVEQDRAKNRSLATEDFIAELIPVIDSFELAFRNKTAWEETPLNWRQGIEYIHSQLLTILSSHGVSVIDPQGARFDPTLHESVGVEKISDASQEGVITDVIQKGFAIHGKLIRAPKVKVGSAEA